MKCLVLRNLPPIVSASQVGQATYCPQALALNLQGAKPTAKAQQAMYEGARRHSRLSQTDLAADRRCYIATHLYGLTDPRTEVLRGFRDAVLVPHSWGRMTIGLYYFLAPLLIRVIHLCPWVSRPIRTCCDWILTAVMKKGSDA